MMLSSFDELRRVLKERGGLGYEFVGVRVVGLIGALSGLTLSLSLF